MPVYQKPNAMLSKVANPMLEKLITTFGVSPAGAHVLIVQGRTSGEPRSVPVNPLLMGNARYLVAPRGETHWVRNIRAAGQGELVLGRMRETISVAEVPDSDKVPILREYLKRWHRMTANNFGVGPDASDEELARIAPNHPVFRIAGGSNSA